jgi:nucleotide-binding universal stress UspA family protein
VEPRVLACLDFSSASAAVLTTATTLAGGLGGEVWLLHVAAEEPALVGFDTDPAGTHNRDDRAMELLAEHAELRALADEAIASGVDVRPLLVAGPTVDTVLETAERLAADWLVVGRHGRSGLAQLLLGSVSDAIVRRSGRPVVVVPPPYRS